LADANLMVMVMVIMDIIKQITDRTIEADKLLVEEEEEMVIVVIIMMTMRPELLLLVTSLQLTTMSTMIISQDTMGKEGLREEARLSITTMSKVNMEMMNTIMLMVLDLVKLLLQM